MNAIELMLSALKKSNPQMAQFPTYTKYKAAIRELDKAIAAGEKELKRTPDVLLSNGVKLYIRKELK